jgi:hypothetical protein
VRASGPGRRLCARSAIGRRWISRPLLKPSGVRPSRESVSTMPAAWTKPPIDGRARRVSLGGRPDRRRVAHVDGMAEGDPAGTAPRSPRRPCGSGPRRDPRAATGRPTAARASALARPSPDAPPVTTMPVAGRPRRGAKSKRGPPDRSAIAGAVESVLGLGTVRELARTVGKQGRTLLGRAGPRRRPPARAGRCARARSIRSAFPTARRARSGCGAWSPGGRADPSRPRGSCAARRWRALRDRSGSSRGLVGRRGCGSSGSLAVLGIRLESTRASIASRALPRRPESAASA